MKINRWMIMILFFIMGIYILAAGTVMIQADAIKNAPAQAAEIWRESLLRKAAASIYPGMFFQSGEKNESEGMEVFLESVLRMHPLRRMEAGSRISESLENEATYEMLIQGGVHDENELDESGNEYDLSALAERENAAAMEEPEEPSGEEAEEPEISTAGAIFNLEELSDYDYLIEHFYTVEPTTMITGEELNAEKLLSKDMTIDKTADGPQILIYHTHSQEGFADSVPGDPSTTIVGAGDYLTELLEEKGYRVMHVTSVYDLIDGKLDRSEAYSRAEEEISQILKETPSIQAVIDLHRDGVAEGTRLVTEIDGKTMARFMFFNGLSRTKKNGPIEYLYNPYIEDNLALTLQLKLTCDQYYPGLARNIYLKSLRYNLHLLPKALLIEAGAQTNTVQEIRNTMEPLADVLDRVFE